MLADYCYSRVKAIQTYWKILKSVIIKGVVDSLFLEPAQKGVMAELPCELQGKALGVTYS